MEIGGSARKWSIADEDIRHAVRNAIRFHLFDGYRMIVGPTRTGALIEVGINDQPGSHLPCDACPKEVPLRRGDDHGKD